MNDQEFDSGMQDLPLEPDEGWWAAVLADEPVQGCEDQIENRGPIGNKEQPPDERQTSPVNWERIRQIYINDEVVELSVVGYNRGGLLVAGEDIHGFVPTSHLIEIPPYATEEEREGYFANYLDRIITLKIIECERDKERIVFSERAALAGQGQRKHLLTCLKEGDVVKGIVTNVTDFGVFVDLGGLEGLIHVSELSWGRVQHPSDILEVGDEIQSVVLQVAEDKGRIALSYKRLEDNPWDVLGRELSIGDLVPAVITSIVKYGAFAKLDQGVEGLIHISSMNFPNGCTHIDDFLFEGQDVNVSVLHIDSRKRRLGLKLESYSVD
ncbi:MAG: S1 RNA-binding domain-containing protein [Anaerolineaceae bacterium]|jgi:small subunit ribosomal protein S1|nr:S1 RNA-binding domain-containing protein [Anaerolineaceae bacterium]